MTGIRCRVQMVVPKSETDVRFKSFAFLIYARWLVDPLRSFAALNGFDKLRECLSKALIARRTETISNLPADTDVSQSSLAETKSRRLIGANKLFGNSSSCRAGRASARRVARASCAARA